MKIQRATPVNEFLAKVIFLMLPVVAISYYLLVGLHQRYSLLENQSWLLATYLAAGMGIAAIFYSFRLRFLPTFALLLVVFYSIYKGLDSYASGEFDTFFITVKFIAFALLFGAGWIIGWGYIRWRFFSVLASVTFLTSSIFIIAHSRIDSVESFLWQFLPVLLFAIHNIFTAEQMYNYKDKSKKFWWFLLRRLFLFSLLIGAIITIVVYLMRPQIKETLAKYGGGAMAKNSMFGNDTTFDLKKYARLSPTLYRSNALLFCAHIDNFFPGTDFPNPLYLTEYYFTRFDTSTETFEPDDHVPYNDLFNPDPSKIPLFSTKMDTSVIRNSLGDSLRKIVDVEIYNVNLSPNTYLAPNVGYFVQPITIEKDYREKFRSAFRTKSYVSLLNSAYFVYNSDTPVIRKFQEDRWKILRHVKDYSKVDPVFMRYYTQMPGGDKYNSISVLAHKIGDSAHTPVDKVLALRNYFKSKTESGEHLYKYTDNPGEPDIPSASKLLYFLNESHKGYCAYYAGATLFLLRSLGIPSRIAVGFLTEDRSDKSKGWYWYYANQAHAWVQVYFPGYGWLDFDTTVSNTDENRPTPQPDGTPPIQPPKAWLAADGTVESTDTIKKLMQFSVKQFVFHDKEYKLAAPITVTLDMKVAIVFRDSLTLPLQKVQKGDDATAVSYAEALKVMEAKKDESSAALLKRLPSPVPTDELYLKRKDTVPPKEKKEEPAGSKPISAKHVLWIVSSILLGILLIILALPELVLLFFVNRYNNTRADRNKPYWAYRAATYYLHMVGINRGTRTPMQYARQVVDPQMGLSDSQSGTSLTEFMNVYLKKKYAQQELNERERQYVDKFLKPFMAVIRSRITFNQRFFRMMNPIKMVEFFSIREDDEKEG